MAKGKFSSLDLRCIIRHLKKDIVGLRVSNVYNINNKTYLFKLSKPDQKLYIVIESGVRIHSTQYDLEKKDLPSVFTLKV